MFTINVKLGHGFNFENLEAEQVKERPKLAFFPSVKRAPNGPERSSISRFIRFMLD